MIKFSFLARAEAKNLVADGLREEGEVLRIDFEPSSISFPTYKKDRS